MEPHVADLGKLAPPTVMHFAELDQFIPLATVDAIKARVAELDHVAVYVYKGAGHAFARPNHAQFDAEAAARAHERTRHLFRPLFV
jgi:carboxymethylenebutenolidase